jgi:precorrin-6x reductase
MGFVRQKTYDKALALSQRNRELAKSNIHKVHLGPGGYQRQLEKWLRQREAAIAVGQPDPFEGLDERAWMWLQVRKPKIVDGKP